MDTPVSSQARGGNGSGATRCDRTSMKSAALTLRKFLVDNLPVKIGNLKFDSQNTLIEPNPEPILVQNSAEIAAVAHKQHNEDSSIPRTQLSKPPSTRVYRNDGEIAPITRSRLFYQRLWEMNDDHSLDVLATIQNFDTFTSNFHRPVHRRRPGSRFMAQHTEALLRIGVVERAKHLQVVSCLFMHFECGDLPHSVLTPHTTGGSREDLPSLEENGCRELTSQVQRSRLSCAGAESRMRNPRMTVWGAIRVQRAATELRCGELSDRQVRRAVNAGSEGRV